ncbi:MAG TPA: hypothetical protein PLT58_01175 [Atribacterota bacterium]|nr:hypothetical protein [Atribacterota bacterium]HOR42781.1 hypothetical protein [Atribacterota bacterium]HPK87492.1 hypothetical protein [Atribacterota bacterium]
MSVYCYLFIAYDIIGQEEADIAAFIKILNNIRQELHITQKQFVHNPDVSFLTLNRWEDNLYPPGSLARMRLIESIITAEKKGGIFFRYHHRIKAYQIIHKNIFYLK